MAMRGKRQLPNSPGSTPEKPSQKERRTSRFGSTCRGKKSLLFSPGKDFPVNKSEELTTSKTPWSDKELSAMVQFIALYHDSSKSAWPIHKNMVFWGKCAGAVAESTGLPKRTDTACRYKIFNYFKQKFKTIDEAEEHFSIQYFDNDVPLRIPAEATASTPISKQQHGQAPANFSPIFHHSPHTEKRSNMNSRGQAMKSICEMFL